MDFWIMLWKIVFIFTITIFSVMAICVTIGGARDIKLLFKKLNQSHQHRQEE